jgi:hypothetical protein
MSLIPLKGDQSESATALGLKFESVDQILLASLAEVQSESLDKNLLIQIYNNL